MKWTNLKLSIVLSLALASLLPFVSQDRLAAPPIAVAKPALAFKTTPDAPDLNHILKLINQRRERFGLQPLLPNAQLTAAAEQRAHDMRTHGYYAHKGSDGRYYNELLQTKGSSCENLDLQFSLESEAYVQDWLNSPSHRACLLDPAATQAGYAVAVMGGIFAHGQAENSYVVVAIHASDPEVVATK